MKYAFMKIMTKEMEVVDENNCIKHLIKGLTVTPIDEIIAKSDEEALEIVMKNYHNLLVSEDRDYLQEYDENYRIKIEYRLAPRGREMFLF